MVRNRLPRLLYQTGLSALGVVGMLYIAADEMRRSDGTKLLVVMGAALLMAILGLLLRSKSDHGPNCT